MIDQELYIGRHRAEEEGPAYAFTKNLIESYELRTGKPLAGNKVAFGIVWEDLNTRLNGLPEPPSQPHKIGSFIGRLLDR